MIKKFKEFIEEGIISKHNSKVGSRDEALNDKDIKQIGEFLNVLLEAGVPFKFKGVVGKELEEEHLFNEPQKQSLEYSKKEKKMLDDFLQPAKKFTRSLSSVSILTTAGVKKIEKQFEDEDVYDVTLEISEWFEKELVKILKKQDTELEIENDTMTIPFEILCADNYKILDIIKKEVE